MLKRRLRLKTGELRLINEILKGFTKYRSVDKVFDHTLRVLYSFWGVEHSFVALFDGGLGELKVKNAFGFLPSEVERAIYSSGEGIVGQTFKLGIPLFATEDELLNKTGLLDRLKGKNLSLFTAPIKGGGKTLGVLAVFKEVKRANKTVEKSLETLAIIGSVLGTFVHLKEEFDRERRAGAEGVITELDTAKYGLVGVSEAAENLRELIKKVAETDAPVLVSGEEGTGKTLVAKIIHLNSPRREKTAAILDLRNTPRGLVERELFGEGDKKGLLESAKDGTLIVKHVELLPLGVQKKLYETIVGGSVRLIATTDRDLSEAVRKGEFLAALYDLLSVVEVKVPPLRERMEDVPVLVKHYLKKYNKRYGKSVELDDGVVKVLSTADLKGNAKELDRIIHRLVLLSGTNERVSLQTLRAIAPHLFKEEKKNYLGDDDNLPLPQKIEEEEKRRIIWALEKTNYVKSRAAKLLGYTLRQLDYRIKKYGIEVKKRKSQ